jgi:MFS family permease
MTRFKKNRTKLAVGDAVLRLYVHGPIPTGRGDNDMNRLNLAPAGHLRHDVSLPQSQPSIAHGGRSQSLRAARARPGRWFIAGLGIGQICSWGSLYFSFPLIAKAMENELGWGRPQLYGAATIGLVLAALLAYPVGAAIDRGHGRAIMAGGSLLAGLALLGWSQVTQLWTFYLMAACVGGLQAATLYEASFAVVARGVAPERVRDSITVLSLWGSFSGTIFIPCVHWLIPAYGWRAALVALAVVNIAVGALVNASAIGGGQRAGLTGGPTQAGAVRKAMALPAFWAFAVAVVAYSLLHTALTFHVYPLLVERGLSTADVVTAIMVIGPAQVASRVAMKVFARRLTIETIGSVVVTLFPLAVLLLAAAPPKLLAAMAALGVYGAANGIFIIVRGLVVPAMISRTDYGAINGVLNALATLGSAVAMVGAALLWSVSGSYNTVLTVMFAAALALVAAFWSAVACARRKQEPRARAVVAMV